MNRSQRRAATFKRNARYDRNARVEPSHVPKPVLMSRTFDQEESMPRSAWTPHGLAPAHARRRHRAGLRSAGQQQQRRAGAGQPLGELASRRCCAPRTPSAPCRRATTEPGASAPMPAPWPTCRRCWISTTSCSSSAARNDDRRAGGDGAPDEDATGGSMTDHTPYPPCWNRRLKRWTTFRTRHGGIKNWHAIRAELAKPSSTGMARRAD